MGSRRHPSADMNNLDLSDEGLQRLLDISRGSDPPPWIAMIEGRDHFSGDSFILIGDVDDRDEDMYVTRDSGPASSDDLELIALARNYLPELVAEIRRLRSMVQRDIESE
jgi:hypothetical protein